MPGRRRPSPAFPNTTEATVQRDNQAARKVSSFSSLGQPNQAFAPLPRKAVAAGIVDGHPIQRGIERAPAALVYRVPTAPAGMTEPPSPSAESSHSDQLEEHLPGHLQHLTVYRPVAGRQHLLFGKPHAELDPDELAQGAATITTLGSSYFPGPIMR
jgi:hypothetical protein